MRGSFDKQPHDDQNADQGWSIKLVALPLLAVVALIGMVLAIRRPSSGFRMRRRLN